MSAHVPEERGVAVYEEHANEGLVLSFNNMAMLGSCDGSSPISATYLVLKLSDDLLVAENDNKILCGAPTPERHPLQKAGDFIRGARVWGVSAPQ